MKYDFSFTASSLRLNEMLMIAEAQLADEDFDYMIISLKTAIVQL